MQPAFAATLARVALCINKRGCSRLDCFFGSKCIGASSFSSSVLTTPQLQRRAFSENTISVNHPEQDQCITVHSNDNTRRAGPICKLQPNTTNPSISYDGNDIRISSNAFYNSIEARLEYKFKNRSLIAEAFLHSSTKSGSVYFDDVNFLHTTNERLEFLGDSLLNFLTSSHLCKALPDVDEGKLTAIRAVVTNRYAQSRYCEQLELGPYLIMHRNLLQDLEEWKYESAINRIYANCLEAVLGAIYLDGQLQAAQRIFERKLLPMMVDVLRTQPPSWKIVLQEALLRSHRSKPDLRYYNISRSGKEIEKFVGMCALNYKGRRVGKGTGGTRSLAESSAARDAMKKMGIECTERLFDTEARILAEKLQKRMKANNI